VTFGPSGTIASILPESTDIYYKWRMHGTSEGCAFVRTKPGRTLKSLLRSMVA
jgi:hypothetical protein